MSVTADRTVVVTYKGDLVASFTFPAASNVPSPGSANIYTLASGTNTITFPTGGTTCSSATIIPPTSNTYSITLKGTTGDTGVLIHKTDPTSIALDTTSTTQTSFVLTVSSTISGLRIIFT